MKRCSFCSRVDGEAEMFIEGDRALICDICIDNAKELIDKHKAQIALEKIENKASEVENTKKD